MNRIRRPILACVRVTLTVLSGHVSVQINPLPWKEKALFPTVSVSPVTVSPVSVSPVSVSPVSVSPVKIRTKAQAKHNEENDIARLIEQLNGSPCPLHHAFETSFPGYYIGGARLYDPTNKKKAGTRSVHYDFEVLVSNEQGEYSWWKVEHKGSIVCREIDPSCPPWTGGVQFYNGGMEKYRLCLRYAEAWYNQYIGSGWLSAEYGIVEPIPSLAEWITKDARVQGNPKTAFGLALKRAVRARGEESLRRLRDEFVPRFVASLTETDYRNFQDDVFPILRDSLSQKDVWLQIAGDVDGSYHARWSRALTVERCGWPIIRGEKDVTGEVDTDCEYPIRFILRWGKGAGFSNLRLDLK